MEQLQSSMNIDSESSSNSKMSLREVALRLSLKNNFDHYSSKCLKIRSKEGKIIPFKMNTAQRYIHQKLEDQHERIGYIRALLLKGRQQGASTYIEGRYYWKTSHGRGKRAFILTHELDATDNLFEMAGRFHENCPDLVKPHTGASNSKELLFDILDSGYKVATAGNKATGRSSTIQYFHGSEVAYWANAADHARGVLQAVPLAPDTEVILESTANGQGGFFHSQWQRASRGEGDFIAIFVPWFWQEEYRSKVPEDFTVAPDEAELVDAYHLTPEQLYWRRKKISELGGGTIGLESFRKEYPNTPEEAFMASVEDVVITPTSIARAKVRAVEQIRGYRTVWGVDVARFGADRSSLAKRRANCMLEPPKWWQKIDTMQLCGKIMKEYEDAIELDELHSVDPNWEECTPAEIMIDVIGLGAGVVDRLKELGLPAKGVNVAESESGEDQFMRLRDELWFKGREWFLGAVRLLLPEGCDRDYDQLAMELSAPKYKILSSGKKQVESKDDMKKRLGFSPDLADSFLNTFAAGLQKIDSRADRPRRRRRRAGSSFMAA